MFRSAGDFRPSTRNVASWITPNTIPAIDPAGLRDMVEAASSQGLSGLVLESHASRLRSRWALDRLRAAASQTAAENLQYQIELAHIACEFEGAMIPLMVLKGAALNLGAYPRLDLRPMTDLDLLVNPAHARAAAELFGSIGYRKGASLLRDDFFPKFHYEQEMIGPAPHCVRVDLHAHPWRPIHLAHVVKSEAFWASAEIVKIGESPVWVPSPETMMVHLSAHAAFHGCSRVIWLYDLKRLAEHHGARLDWECVANRAERWQVAGAVRHAIAQAETILGPIAPTHFRIRIAEVSVSWRQRLTLWHAPKDASSPMLHVFCNVLSLHGLRARFAYLEAMLLPGRDHLSELYPFRHFGWSLCAQMVRGARAASRAIATAASFFRSQPRIQGAAC